MTAPTAFASVSALVRRETSMVYDEGKEYLVEARLTPLANAKGLDLEQYVARLAFDADERRKVVDALTINETRLLPRPHALPGLHRRHAPAAAGGTGDDPPAADLERGLLQRPGGLLHRDAARPAPAGRLGVRDRLHRHLHPDAGAGARRALQPGRGQPRAARDQPRALLHPGRPRVGDRRAAARAGERQAHEPRGAVPDAGQPST
ncbi:hypothetical protein [Nocardioides convexus]|uniref:hypothetical protein n=1 Tax=Nocardioides convexus TaxID=2712224 RepID=UPI002418472D|nr:hypothetical protein [Nocardioides convexus]